MDYSDLLAAMSAKKEIQIKYVGHWVDVAYAGLFSQMARGEPIEWRERVKKMVQNKQSVPAPVKDRPVFGSLYYVPSCLDDDFYSEFRWYGDPLDEGIIARGLVYATAADAAARAQAMLNISEE